MSLTGRIHMPLTSPGTRGWYLDNRWPVGIEREKRHAVQRLRIRCQQQAVGGRLEDGELRGCIHASARVEVSGSGWPHWLLQMCAKFLGQCWQTRDEAIRPSLGMGGVDLRRVAIQVQILDAKVKQLSHPRPSGRAP